MLATRQVADFERDGFLVVPGVIDPGTLEDVRAAFAARVGDMLLRYARAGRAAPALAQENRKNLTSRARRMGRELPVAGGFADNLLSLLQIAPEAYQHLDISLPMISDMKSEVPQWQELFGDDWREEAGLYAGESIYRLLTHPNVVALARQLVGDDVVASPVQHVRIKPPQHLLPGASQIDANTARTLWHQDEGVVSVDARGVNILTVWLAITDATEENGCMEAVPGSHKEPDSADNPDFGLTMHCPGKGKMVGELYIPEADIKREQVRPLVAKAGDAVLLHKRCVHGAGANRSAGLRWSFDLRYQPANTPTGRDFFPSCPVGADSAAAYRQRWLDARDAIISGEREAVFNTRWNKYGDVPLCA